MNKDNDTLRKRARSKFISDSVSNSLYYSNPESPLNKSYYGSRLCSRTIHQSGQKLSTRYCRQRWCSVCNRIKTAKLISSYVPVLDQLVEPYFVTLTKRTVPTEELEDSIKLMDDTWRRILRSDANRSRKIRGIRKCECTIRPNNHYHYHYHVIVEGEEAAKWLVGSWLSRLPDVTGSASQNIKSADSGSIQELFKYFTKLLTNTGKDGKEFIPAQRMDVIFQLMKGKRVFQSFGKLRSVREDNNFANQIYDIIERNFDVWNWKGTDWYNEDEEALTGYKPSEKLKELADKFKSVSSS